jgi:dCTP deaminase
MSILPAQAIRRLCQRHRPADRRMITPFHERTVENGMTFGLSAAGYDVRIAEDIRLYHGQFSLASTMERFDIPDDVLARVCDKSTWARRGLAVQNTVIEPGWHGWLTLELTNHAETVLVIPAGAAIAQIIFERLEEATDQPYSGKYQAQAPGPQRAISEPAE